MSTGRRQFDQEPGFKAALSRVLWFFAFVGSCYGFYYMLGNAVLVMPGEATAIQQGAAAAIGVGLGVLPYVTARAWDAMRG